MLGAFSPSPDVTIRMPIYDIARLEQSILDAGE
jgi:hypothetical protein